MARDGQIRLPDGGAPASYEVPNAAEIIPKAINATFDGTGASGSFVPTVEIISDGGVVIARVPCQTTVAAGDSAECTFAPFLRASSSSLLTPVWGNYDGATQTLAAGATGTLSWSLFNGTALLDLSDPTHPQPLTKGVYLVSALWQGVQPWTVGYGAQVNLASDYGTGLSTDDVPVSDAGLQSPRFTATLFSPMNTANKFNLHWTNLDTGSRQANASITVWYIGAF